MSGGNNNPPTNPPGKPVKITLTVEASSLFALGGTTYTQAQVDALCTLSDDNNDGTSTDVRTYVSNVYLAHNVQWVGEVKFPDGVDKGYSIGIDSIVHEATKVSDPNAPSNQNFFTGITMPGGGGRSSNVNAVVNNNPSLINQLDVYTINFSVYDQQNNSFSFPIDPKLQANN